MNTPKERSRRDLVDPERVNFDCYLDALHTAMFIYSEDGGKNCERFLNDTGLRAITLKLFSKRCFTPFPERKKEGHFIIPEAELLDNIRLAFFDDLVVPLEDDEKLLSRAGCLWISDN